MLRVSGGVDGGTAETPLCLISLSFWARAIPSSYRCCKELFDICGRRGVSIISGSNLGV